MHYIINRTNTGVSNIKKKVTTQCLSTQSDDLIDIKKFDIRPKEHIDHIRISMEDKLKDKSVLEDI